MIHGSPNRHNIDRTVERGTKRKFAFDSGEYGMGTMANELALGCDCLGQIHYLVRLVPHDTATGH